MDVMLENPEGCITTNFMHISFNNNRMELLYLLSSHHVPAQITTWSPIYSKRWSAATHRAINMADPSGHVPNNEFRERLVEKVQLNVTETGKLAQQLLKSSRSHEVNCTTEIWF